MKPHLDDNSFYFIPLSHLLPDSVPDVGEFFSVLGRLYVQQTVVESLSGFRRAPPHIFFERL